MDKYELMRLSEFMDDDGLDYDDFCGRLLKRTPKNSGVNTRSFTATSSWT